LEVKLENARTEFGKQLENVETEFSEKKKQLSAEHDQKVFCLNILIEASLIVMSFQLRDLCG
jgi:hypothetical protein